MQSSKGKIAIQHMLAFLQDNYTTVGVKFYINDSILTQGKTYTYKVLLTDDVKVGDTCVVDVNGIAKTVQVVEVHTTPRIDTNATYPYKWIVQKVDYARYEKQVDVEGKVRDMFFEIEREQARKDFVANFKDSLEGNEKAMALFDDAIKMLNPEKAIAHGG